MADVKKQFEAAAAADARPVEPLVPRHLTERRRQGLVMDASIQFNLSLASLRALMRRTLCPDTLQHPVSDRQEVLRRLDGFQKFFEIPFDLFAPD